MSTATDRTRLWRRRVKNGRVLFKVEANRFELADALVQGGFLREWDSDNRLEIRDALQRLVDMICHEARGDTSPG